MNTHLAAVLRLRHVEPIAPPITLVMRIGTLLLSPSKLVDLQQFAGTEEFVPLNTEQRLGTLIPEKRQKWLGPLFSNLLISRSFVARISEVSPYAPYLLKGKLLPRENSGNYNLAKALAFSAKGCDDPHVLRITFEGHP